MLRMCNDQKVCAVVECVLYWKYILINICIWKSLGSQIVVKPIFYYHLGFWHQATKWNSIKLNYLKTTLSLIYLVLNSPLCK